MGIRFSPIKRCLHWLNSLTGSMNVINELTKEECDELERAFDKRRNRRFFLENRMSTFPRKQRHDTDKPYKS